MKEGKQSKKKAGRLILGSTVTVIFVLLAIPSLATPVAAFTPSLSAGSISLSRSATPNVMDTTVTSPNAQLCGFFGSAVAASGSILVVGAPFETANGQGGAGHAYTFKAETGPPISTLTSPNAQPFGVFGWSVAASGSILVVGAPVETANGQGGAGHAYTFKATTGALIGTLTSPNAQSNGDFGFSVAVSGSILVVGAPDETANGQVPAGHAYTFKAETGALISTLTSPNAQPGGGFGSSVAASRSILVVGAPFETVNGQVDAGHAYIF